MKYGQGDTNDFAILTGDRRRVESAIWQFGVQIIEPQ